MAAESNEAATQKQAGAHPPPKLWVRPGGG